MAISGKICREAKEGNSEAEKKEFMAYPPAGSASN
jgi:hypothetical protein